MTRHDLLTDDQLEDIHEARAEERADAAAARADVEFYHYADGYVPSRWEQ